MKYFISSIFFLLIFTGIINAREKSGSLNINTQFSFFKDKYSDNSFIPINPGGEILYELGLNNKLTLSSGINYSFSIWKHSVGAKSTFKRLAHEIYFPVLIKLKLNQKFFTEFGIYPGWLIKGKELYINNIDIKNWQDNTENTSYNSSPKFSADLYFGAGINHIVNEKRTIRFIPFIKYKIKDNWMEKTREKTSFGLKISIPISI